MDAPRRTGLLLTAAVCGSLALGTVPAVADAPPVAPAPLPAARPLTAPVVATAPDELRRISADAVRALDQDAVGQRAAEAVVACDSLARPSQEQGVVCGAVRDRIGVLAGARSELQQQATSPAPDRARIDCAREDARRAREGLDPSDERDRYDGSGPRHESGWDRDSGRPYHGSVGDNGGLLGVLGRLGSMTIGQAQEEIARLAKLFGIPGPGR
ncbi:hypothetical protein I5Q34_32455 [Streptomyces sp. AV19]|uniref:hypothetical protein n=1 Tax=Streptomyces sp. AV19 TaxID=2793068 RepID=UPI0018FE6AA9|nr:hypothetical protein [Streptomyces sp. AV19]MBH1938918.1 hypothetical protein [Streptomyces sp. AV19]MDG4533323.1 hypothetical protein [Streptomyces sp. AV19]